MDTDEDLLSQLPNEGLKTFFIVDLILSMQLIIIIEPRHEISNNVVCATSKASDQTAHTHSLIRAIASG